jgi:hypothetical protein
MKAVLPAIYAWCTAAFFCALVLADLVVPQADRHLIYALGPKLIGKGLCESLLTVPPIPGLLGNAEFFAHRLHCLARMLSLTQYPYYLLFTKTFLSHVSLHL